MQHTLHIVQFIELSYQFPTAERFIGYGIWISLYQLYLFLSVAHVLHADGPFMPQHVTVRSVLVHVYDIMHLVDCNDRTYL